MVEISAQLIFVIVINLVFYGNSQSVNGAETCALLYKAENFTGDQYIFRDETQVTNFDEEHISVDNVWNRTLSFTVQSGCQLTVCNETYFNGYCQKFSEQQQELGSEFANILSGNCTCEKDCKCSDINMRSTSCGRAYFKPGCNVCNPYYTDLKGAKSFFPEEYTGKIAAVKVRDGCHLTIFEGEDYEGDPIHIKGTVENWTENIGSYECTCPPESMKPRAKKPRPSTYPAFIDVPSTIEDVISMLSGDNGGHPGLLAAKKSLRNKRSSKNVYILTIGSTGAGKSSTINLLFDNSEVTKVGNQSSTTKDIHEFRIPLPIDELGIGNSELRVIDTPGMGDTNGLSDDAKFLATLDDYLSNHEELHNRIPNVVLIFHKFNDNRFAGPQSNFVKMLRGFDSFKERITDSTFSNVIFVLSHFCSEVKSTRTRPSGRIAQFKNAIESYTQFPKPIMIVVAENKAAEDDLPMVNGYFKLPNGDYYPRNIFEKIQFATSNGGDPIGEAVITTGFRDADEFNITSVTHTLVNPKDKRITKYYDILVKAEVEINNTEVSQLLAASYEGMNSTLKKIDPNSLYYLQKALNVRSIGTVYEIPKTTVKILELMSSLKQNEAIMYLLENALKLKAPLFPENVVTGYSYDVFKDTLLSKSPYKLGDVKITDIGYLFPSAMTCSKDNKVQDFFKTVENRGEYFKQRLSSLGVQGHLSEEVFTGTLKPGFNLRAKSFMSNSCKVTAVREFRTFSLNLNDKPNLTPEFTETLRKLPVFDESDHENVNTWNTFFANYGSHVVKQVYGGGAIEIELTSDRPCDANVSQALIGLIQFAEDLTAISEHSKNVLTGGEIRHQLTFKGGDKAYHASDLTAMPLGESFTLLQNWKESLRLNPTILTTEMQLLPMSEVAKKVGQNISSEIQRATLLLYNSSIVYTPRPKISSPGPSREDTSLPANFNLVIQTMVGALINQSRESNLRSDKLLKQMKDDQVASELRWEKANDDHIKWQKEQELRRDNETRLQTEERNRREEAFRNLTQIHIQEIKDSEAKRKEADRIHKLKEASARETADKLREEKHRLELEKQHLEDTSSCLKKGTPILLADGNEKPVEELQIGDLIVDHEMNPTRVLGLSSEFLLDETFYGFDNNSFFFTNSHILVGPGNEIAAKYPESLRFYAQNKDRLLRQNPLMEYIGIEQMTGENFKIYHFDNMNRNVAPKSVNVYKDPEVYPVDAMVYFIQVDNPAGTYFANGYVCRHEIPPVEFWPNTMAILFSLHTNPEFMSFGNVPYTLTSLSFIHDVVTEVKFKIEETLNSFTIKDLNAEDPVMELDSRNSEIVINSIFNHPSFSVFGMGLYNQVGVLMSRYLDDCKVNNCVPSEYLGSLQKLLANEISKQISKSVQSKI